jgi:NAD(P)-dependent dehydrogenase (short-subunit alcohol dehydrogenase family)
MHTIRQRYGRLDVVFATARVGVFKPTAEITGRDFDYSVDVNFKNVFFTIQKAIQRRGVLYRQCAGVVRDCAARLLMNWDGLQDRILAVICQATPDHAARYCDVEGHQLGQAECWMSIPPLG